MEARIMETNPIFFSRSLGQCPEIDREGALAQVFGKPLWDERDLAIIFDVEIDTIMHMKSKGQIPAVCQFNLRCWLVSRDGFLEHVKSFGMPRPKVGRPSGSKNQP